MFDNSYMGTQYVNATPAAGATGTGEQTIMTYTLKANEVNANGQRLRIRCWFSGAANGNNKTYKLYFGATSFSSGTLTDSGKYGFLELNVVRTGSAAQVINAQGSHDTTALSPANTAGTDDFTTDLTIKATVQGGTTGADCTIQALAVELAFQS